MRLLQWLGHDIAQWEVEISPVIFAAAIPEHRNDRAHRILPDRALFREIAVEGFELGDAGALAHAEFDAAAADQVECRNPLGDAGGVNGGQLHDAMRQAALLGALARPGEEDLESARARILLQ